MQKNKAQCFITDGIEDNIASLIMPPSIPFFLESRGATAELGRPGPLEPRNLALSLTKFLKRSRPPNPAYEYACD